MSNLEKFVGQSVELPCFDYKPELGQVVKDVRISCSFCERSLCKDFYWHIDSYFVHWDLNTRWVNGKKF